MKILRIKSIVIVSALGLLLFFTGCKKIDKEIVGKWKYETLGKENLQEASWTFNDDNTLVRAYLAKNGRWYYDSCNYSVKTNFLKKELTIQNSKILPIGIQDASGVYKIESFKKGQMDLTRFKLSDGTKNGAYLRAEMKKTKN